MHALWDYVWKYESDEDVKKVKELLIAEGMFQA